MSYRLALARLWMGESVMSRQLARVAEMTNAVLDDMLEDHAPDALEAIRAADDPMVGDLELRRRAMADGHRRRVAALVAALGEEEAVARGRRRLLPLGERLGMEARARLGLGDDLDELVEAAELLYQVLGISLESEEADDGSRVLTIERCSLSHCYDATTCRVMSAADEGMVRGLNPKVSMTFRERITEEHPHCRAVLVIYPDGEA